jgi:hypothetical protein
MAQYATCECYYCHIRLPKPDAYHVTIERETGHSSGSFRFYSKSRSSSYSTGRTYYAKRDIWLCGNCYLQYKKQQRLNALASFVVAGLFVVGGIWIFGSNNTSQPPSQKTAGISANQPSVSEPTDQKALYQGQQNSTDTRPPAATLQIQSRLVQLGYLAGPPDGIWGAKSQKALRAFKAANALDPNDSWDDATSAALFSPGAAYAPAPPASQASAGARRNQGR